jgi:hypothetical protein
MGEVLRGGGVGVFADRIDGGGFTNGGVVASYLAFYPRRQMFYRMGSYLGVLGWTK